MYLTSLPSLDSNADKQVVGFDLGQVRVTLRFMWFLLIDAHHIRNIRNDNIILEIFDLR